MSQKYNIYRIDKKNKILLKKKMKQVKLNYQKGKKIDDYKFSFYFSDQLTGEPVWWYETYKEFFKSDSIIPTNYFYYALMIIENENRKLNYFYLISLGKSHFYLNKYIDRDFGINMAMRIANEGSTLLKKSRFFGGIKRQEIVSYLEFNVNNYAAGESVEHLKANANNKEIWGTKNIIFADSIQMDLDLKPEELIPLLKAMETEIKKKELIRLPKLELVKDGSLIIKLDKQLKKQLLLADKKTIKIEEFTTYGVSFCFNYENFDYEIYYYDKNQNLISEREYIGSTIDISDIKKIIKKIDEDYDVDNLKIKFMYNGTYFTKSIKYLIDFHSSDGDDNFFLRDGTWYRFNQKFMEYLKKSLEKIEIEYDTEFDENKYRLWKAKKNKLIKKNTSDNKLTYREYYFNTYKASKERYLLLDRKNECIDSLKKNAKKYSVEISDLYKNKTVYAVKIGSDKKELIYNIEQSKDSLELITKNVINFKKKLERIGLWFVLADEITKITDINSIQFLLAVESWQKKVIQYGYKPVIKFTKRINI